ncbi:MAG: S1C family serine protease [Vicinamibacterales bacterium]
MPPGVEVCRCGTSRPAAPALVAADEDDGEPRSAVNPTTVLLGGAAVVALGAFLLWASADPPPASRPPALSSPTGSTPTSAPPVPQPRVEIAPTSETMAAESAPASDAFAAPAPAAAAAPADPPATVGLEDLVARIGPGVVMVESGPSRGTGFFVRPDLIVTNDHVVAGSTAVTVRLHDGSARAARVERTVADVDLALLRVSGAGSPVVLPLGQVAGVRTGQEVIAIGSALGLQNTVTRGIVSAQRRAGSVVLLQTDAAINPGNSGGPLVDRQGVVVGVTTLKMGGQAEGLGFAVAADHVAALVDGQSSTQVAVAAGAPPAGPAAAASPSAMPGLTPGGSTAEARRADGEQVFERTVGALAQQAAQVDGYWQRFTSACAPRSRPGGDREWFGLADGRVDYTGRDRNCPYWLNDMTSMSREFETAMRAAGDAARRAGVYPGTLRDVRRRHRLDWPGFDR